MVDSITFDGKNSYEDFGLTMPVHPQIQFPDKIKKKTRIPGTNTIIDHDENEQTQEYAERIVTCVFNIVEFDYMNVEETQYLASKIMNWLMGSHGKRMLTLDIIPFWHFMAEVEQVGDWETDLFEFGTIEVDFVCYPFKIYDTPEGNDEWDTINFDLDIKQQVSFELKPIASQLPLKKLKAGDMITIGGWGRSSPGDITGVFGDEAYNFHAEQFHEILDVRDNKDENHSRSIYDSTQYKIETGEWIRAQDVVQARNDFVEITLYNSGQRNIMPNITQDSAPNKEGALLGITLERDGNFYNLRSFKEQDIEDVNNKFALRPGENTFKFYGQDNLVNFIWHKEMI